MYEERFADNNSIETSWLWHLLWNLTKRIQALPLNSSVTLRKLLNLSESHFQYRDNFLKGQLGVLSEKNLYKVPVQFSTHIKHSMKTAYCTTVFDR